MENNYFDDWIKKELDDFDVPLEPNDWALMEGKLDQDFDDWVKEGIEEPTVPLGAGDWARMENRLEEEDRFQERYFIIKAFEVVILGLVLLTVAQFLPYGEVHYSTSPTMEYEQIDENETDTELLKVIPSPKNLPSLNKEEFERTPTQDNKEMITPSKENTPAKIFAESQPTLYIKEQPSEVSTFVETEEGTLSEQAPTQMEANNSYGSSSSSEKELISAIKQKELKQAIASIINDKVNLSQAVETNMLEDNRLAAVEMINTTSLKPFEFQDLDPSLLKFKSPKRLRLGMHLSPDVNVVFTPYSEKLQESYQQVNAGFSGGFTVGFGKDRWETETGVTYSLVAYRPKAVIEIKGSVENTFYAETLKDIEFDLVSVPLNFSYNFLYHKGWKFYAKSGGTFNVVALSKYYQRQDVISSALVPSSQQDALLAAKRPSPDTKGGLFVDGTFRDNYFVTANFGLGAERLLTNNFSLYVEPSFSHTVHGAQIGPNNDKINAFSLNMGAKITL